MIIRRELLKMGIGAAASVFAVPQAFANAEQGITIKHAFGETYLPKPAKRIVTTGIGSEDAALALGVVPVGLIQYPSFDGGVFPWNKPLLKGQKPFFIDYIIDYEQIALLKPDAIISVLSGMSENEYKKLSKIAPVIPYISKPWMANWEEVLKITSIALGKEQEADILIKQTNENLKSYFDKYPILKDKKFLYGAYSSGSNNLAIYTLNDPRVALLEKYGLQPASIVQKISKDNPDKWYYDMSLELAEAIDADILLLWFIARGGEEDAKNNPLMHYVKAFKQDTYIAISKPDEVWALAFPSVVSIPYFYPKLVQRLAEKYEASKVKNEN